MQSSNKETDEIKEPTGSTDQNLDLKEPETPMEIDISKENDQLSSASMNVTETLFSDNMKSAEEVAQVPQNEDTMQEKITETSVESTTNNSSAPREISVDEDENENSGTNHEAQKDGETSVQNLGDQNEAGNSDDDNPMETDTNDFELRFSTADFDTNLQLIDFENEGRESGPSSKILENEKSDLNETEVSETSAILEKEKNEKNGENGGEQAEDEAANSKGHVIGLPPPDLDDNLPKKSLRNKIPSCYLKGKPSLRGTPGITI